MIGSISDSYPDMKSLLIGAGNSTERRIGGGEFTDLTVLDLPGADIINLLDAKEIVLHDLNVLPYPFEDDRIPLRMTVLMKSMLTRCWSIVALRVM
jgi:hypothetical protein